MRYDKLEVLINLRNDLFTIWFGKRVTEIPIHFKDIIDDHILKCFPLEQIWYSCSLSSCLGFAVGFWATNDYDELVECLYNFVSFYNASLLIGLSVYIKMTTLFKVAYSSTTNIYMNLYSRPKHSIILLRFGCSFLQSFFIISTFFTNNHV